MSEKDINKSANKIVYWEICADGTIDIYYSSGITTKIYLDGTEISRSDKGITVYFPESEESFIIPKEKTNIIYHFSNNDSPDWDNIVVKSFIPNGRKTIYTPTIFYPYKEIGEKIYSRTPNGLQTLYFPSGKTITIYVDGTIQEMYPNGYARTIHKNGSIENIFPNGNRDTVFPDGTHQITVKTNPFGYDEFESFVISSEDGSIVRLVYHGGTIKFYDDTGFIKIYDTGKVIAKVSDENTPSTTILYNIDSSSNTT